MHEQVITQLQPNRLTTMSTEDLQIIAAICVAQDNAAERYGNGKGWTLLYLGDFDPSGIDIDRSLRNILRSHGCRPNVVILFHELKDMLA